MKIKKLIVRKTKPSEEIIREIPFNEKGLSLIIDNTPKDIRESGNSVGKSTAIKIIDLCLFSPCYQRFLVMYQLFYIFRECAFTPQDCLLFGKRSTAGKVQSLC